MKLVVGNAWKVIDEYDALCITTNGVIKKNGCAVMGAGIAKECSNLFPSVPRVLGNLMSKHGNRVMKLGEVNGRTSLLSFPTKHNWWEIADIDLIEKSCKELVELADKFGYKKILLPRPGCGNGKLKWNDVKVVLEKYLDDRFYIISFK